MTDDPGDMVAIGTAGDPMEGAMVREFLTSNGIDCMIQGENHRSMLQMIGAYIELRILVPKSQAEEAAALLADFRSQAVEREPAEGEEEEGEEEEQEEDDGEEEGSNLSWREDAELVRKARGARLVALALPGFGLGHFAVGARVRGLILFLAAWPAAIWLAARTPAAFALVPISAFIDFLGAPAALAEVRRRRARTRIPRLARASPKDLATRADVRLRTDVDPEQLEAMHPPGCLRRRGGTARGTRCGCRQASSRERGAR